MPPAITCTFPPGEIRRIRGRSPASVTNTVPSDAAATPNGSASRAAAPSPATVTTAASHPGSSGGGFFAAVRQRQIDTAAIAEADARAVGSQAWSAERVYEREWAETLLRTALDRLAEECALAGKDELFKQLNSHLSVTSDGAVPYEEMSLQLGRPITTLRSDVARLRSRYRAILREEVGGTVAQASEVDAELRHLCEVLMAD